MERRRARIVIIEDHDLFAETLDMALTKEGYDVHRLPPPEAGRSPRSLLSTVARLAPRVVLLDLDLGAFGDASRLITPLAADGANVVVVTSSTDRARWGGCLHRGARKIVPKSRPLNEVLSVVRRLTLGQAVLDRREAEELIALWRVEADATRDIRARLDLLTGREREILKALMDGMTVHEIARQSTVSVTTVRTQVKSILAKLDVSSQLAAVGRAHQVGWQPPATPG